MAAKTASVSSSPPPDPVNATVTPSLPNAAASSADIDLLYMSLSLLQLQLGDDVTIEFKLAFQFGSEFIPIFIHHTEILSREELLIVLLLGDPLHFVLHLRYYRRWRALWCR